MQSRRPSMAATVHRWTVRVACLILAPCRVHRVTRAQSDPCALQRKPQRPPAAEFLFRIFVGRIQERITNRHEMRLHAFHLFERDGAEDVFDVVEFRRADSHGELRIVEDIGKGIVRAFAHKDGDTACVDGVLHSERPAWVPKGQREYIDEQDWTYQRYRSVGGKIAR